MRFSDRERDVLLAVKGVGPKVVERLEEQGLGAFERLALADPALVCARAAASLGSTCWRNSPQAHKAVEAAVAAARSSLETA